MSSLASTVNVYQLSQAQANVLGAPVGANMFGENDQVYTTDNASTKAQYGISPNEAISYDAANYQLFNTTMELGVDCGRLNTAAGRPNLGVATGGSACYPASIGAQRASKQMDPSYNSYGPTADDIVLAQGDIRYAPARFADQNNYNGPTVSDGSYQPRLMGTRDVAQSGCDSSGIDQTIGGMSLCAVADDPLPYPNNTDPRAAYGVNSPHTEYWSPLSLAGDAYSGCSVMASDMASSTMCGVDTVQTGASAPVHPNYVGEQASRSGHTVRLNKGMYPKYSMTPSRR